MIQHCSRSGVAFSVEPEDLEFYRRIGVPIPTLCPDERMRRRLSFRNESKLYHRKCDATKQNIISMYSPDKPLVVYDNDFWWGDGWDSRSFGRDFDFARPFFPQFTELLANAPKMARIQQGTNENSKYTNCAGNNKNCYLLFSSSANEDCSYGSHVRTSRTCFDNYAIHECELAYQCVECFHSYDIQYCREVYHSNTMRHCLDCRGCNHCFACAGLRNASYQILNRPVSRSEFERFLSDKNAQRDALRRYNALYLSVPRIYADFVQCEHCTGSYLTNCKNASYCWSSDSLEDCKYCSNTLGLKSAYDVDYYGVSGLNELLYECEGVGLGLFQVYFSKLIWGGCSDITYSYECFSSKNLFGCAGMKNGEYCILNKQYSKAEYDSLVPRIIEHMKLTHEWGEFFPTEISPFGYNETLANEVFPMRKEEVVARGWKWRDEASHPPSPLETYNPPESITDVTDEVLEKVLVCELTGKPYKITRQELQFYRNQNIPLPTLHPEARHLERLHLRQPRKLHQRTCDQCTAPILSTYPVDAPEKVCCESCYLAYIK
ncbi:MAG: hypothetical protein U0136_11290 [Bdellovibrionota bacterium]